MRHFRPVPDWLAAGRAGRCARACAIDALKPLPFVRSLLARGAGPARRPGPRGRLRRSPGAERPRRCRALDPRPGRCGPSPRSTWGGHGAAPGCSPWGHPRPRALAPGPVLLGCPDCNLRVGFSPSAHCSLRWSPAWPGREASPRTPLGPRCSLCALAAHSAPHGRAASSLLPATVAPSPLRCSFVVCSLELLVRRGPTVHLGACALPSAASGPRLRPALSGHLSGRQGWRRSADACARAGPCTCSVGVSPSLGGKELCKAAGGSAVERGRSTLKRGCS